MGDKFYRKSFPALAAEYIKSGLSLSEIAAKFGLTLDQLYVRARAHPDFAAALCLPFCGELLDDKVEEALLRRALGYQSKEIYSEEVVDAETGEPVRLIKRRTVIKSVPPDVRAALVWLENHRPEKWQRSSESGLATAIELAAEDHDLL